MGKRGLLSIFVASGVATLTAYSFSASAEKHSEAQTETKTIHVVVALADNKHQGIVPVAAALGDGLNPKTNLYWGAMYGMKTYFSRSKDWTLIPISPGSKGNPGPDVLERVVFKHKSKNAYLVADAYDGRAIRKTIVHHLAYLGGHDEASVLTSDSTPPDETKILSRLKFGGASDLAVFIGHDGLMDFSLDPKEIEEPLPQAKGKRGIVLACASRKYFSPHYKSLGANPLLWTSNLMAPEAYILHDALDAWLGGKSDEQVRDRAARAYAKYQKISIKGARGLLVTGY